MAKSLRSPPKEIFTENLILRTRNQAHTHEMALLIDTNRKHLREWMPWEEHSKDEQDVKEYFEDAVRWWNEGSQFDISLFEKTSQKMIGSFATYDIDWVNKKCLVGFWLGKKYQGKGYISEALAKLEQVLLDLGLHRISITCDRRNIKSQKVALRNQYKFEALIIDDCIERGILRDTLKFTKLINKPIDGAITLNLPEGYLIREVDEASFYKLTGKLTDKMRAESTSIKSDNAKGPFDFESRNLPKQSQICLCLFFENTLVGWIYGSEDSSTSFWIKESHVITEHQGRRLYSQLLDLLLVKAKAAGFNKIWCSHKITDNKLIIAKLKRGFEIIELEEKNNSNLTLIMDYSKDIFGW